MLKLNVVARSQLPYLFSNCVKISVGKSYLLHNASRSILQNSHFRPHGLLHRLNYSLTSSSHNVPPVHIYEELQTIIAKDDMKKILDDFSNDPLLSDLKSEFGLDINMVQESSKSFKKYCLGAKMLPPELDDVFYKILHGKEHIHGLFPFFKRHAMNMNPKVQFANDLKHHSQFTNPTSWYHTEFKPKKKRRVIYHAGPTNSGKTFHALQRFTASKSGLYCGPLRLLASEIFQKTNASGATCDLITGEGRKYMSESGRLSSHQACTVEMTNLTRSYEVAVIDEIQMIRDPQRGGAWTRAFLEVCADEVYVCGEESGVEFIRDLTIETGDSFEVKTFKRMTGALKKLNRGIDSFDRIRPGDCIVCFSKNDICEVVSQLDKRGVEVAVIYGSLPPGAKLAEAEKFNDPNDPCKVMVATDAIGMGLNLNIKRVIFYSLEKVTKTVDGEKEVDLISPSSALQIAGRAGRYRTQFPEGEVTTFNSQDLETLHRLLHSDVEPIKQGGILPTAERIESFASYLQGASLSDIIDSFGEMCAIDDPRYFLCDMTDIKVLADMIQDIPLRIGTRYTFCCAPVSRNQAFVGIMFKKFASQYSKGIPVTCEWLSQQVGWPLPTPVTKHDLEHLEGVYDVFDLYLWLSYRLGKRFPDSERLKKLQEELDEIIQTGLLHYAELIENGDNIDTPGRSRRRHSQTAPPEIKIETKEGPQKSNSSKISKEELVELERRMMSLIKPNESVAEQLVRHGFIRKQDVQNLEKEFSSKEKEQPENPDDSKKRASSSLKGKRTSRQLKEKGTSKTRKRTVSPRKPITK